MKHVVAGALHLVVHPRPARFGATHPVADLAPLDLAAPRLGAGAIGDFAWNRLVGFDACIQCGRCESVCPANAAGQPLNPKALIQDLVGSTCRARRRSATRARPIRPGSARALASRSCGPAMGAA